MPLLKIQQDGGHVAVTRDAYLVPRVVNEAHNLFPPETSFSKRQDLIVKSYSPNRSIESIESEEL